MKSSPQSREWKMINRLKMWWFKLWCLHEWQENLVSKTFVNNMAVYGKGILKEYICKRCGKVTLGFVEPVSFYYK